MKRENRSPDTGLSLGSPRMTTAEVALPMRFIYNFFVMLLGVSGAFGCFYTAFSIPVTWNTVIACAVLFSAAFTMLFLTGRIRILVTVLIVLCLGAFLFLSHDQLFQGFNRTINAVIQAYAPKTDYVFKMLPVKPAIISEITVFNTVFAVFILLLMTLFMAWSLIRRKNVFLCILATIPFVGAPLSFTVIPHYAAVMCLLVFWAFLFFDAPNRRKHPASFILLPVLTACLILVNVAFPKQSFQRSDFVNDIRNGLISGANLSSLFGAGGVAVNTNRVNLRLAGNISFSGETVLRVKTSAQNADYLKGFVGSVYTGESWEALPEEDCQELNAILNKWKVQNFPNMLTQLLDPDYTARNAYDMTVQNVAGNPRCIYSPYGLISEPEDLSGIDFVNDGFLRSGNTLFGMKEYSLKAINLFEAVNRALLPAYTVYFTDDGTVITESIQYNMHDNIGQTDEWTIPDETFERLSPEQKSFVQSSYEYTDFVYSHYTQLPEGLRDKLDQYRQAHNLETGLFWSPYHLALSIVNCLQGENTYTLSPGGTPEGRDFAEYFLFENHRGYCMHFASAAVVLLRSAGVPARYVEGYTVTPADSQNPDGWIDIPDSCAHAWVEIYLGGVGWIPVEATPGAQNGAINYEAVAAANPSSNETSTEEASAEPRTSAQPGTPKAADDPQGQENDEAHSSESEKPGEIRDEDSPEETPKTEVWILAAFAAIDLFAAVLLIIRKLHITSRNKSFLQADRNKAVLAIYDYIQKLTPYTKSEQDFSVENPDNLYDLVLKARFSQHVVTEQEVRELLDYAEQLANQAHKNAPLVSMMFGFAKCLVAPNDMPSA